MKNISMKKGNLDHIICRNLIKYTWKIKEKIKNSKRLIKVNNNALRYLKSSEFIIGKYYNRFIIRCPMRDYGYEIE